MIKEEKIFRQKLDLDDGIYHKETNLNTTKLIQEFYKSGPFPNYKKNDNKNSILKVGDQNFVAKKIKDKFKFNSRILEVGSGTCQLSNYLAIGTNNKIVAMDATVESLILGKKFSDENSIKNITFVKADLFEDIFNHDIFDLVWCSGVLHHTKDPYKGFKNILKYAKINGYIIVGLYNKIFRVKTIIRRYLYKIFGKKLIVYLDPHIRRIKNEEDKINSWINDQYKHPVESLQTFDEVIKWFELNNVEYINSIPSFENVDNDKLFEKSHKGDWVSRMLTQFFSIFSPLADEGGLFVMIGKKNGPINK